MKWQELKKLKKIKLEANEKTDLRCFLSVRIASDSRHIYQRSFLYFNLFNRRNMFAGILAIILLITGGGTSFAAEGSVPGDILYQIKIEVNEKVLSALTFNEEKKADWSTRQAERRLEEANKLAEGGKLNSKNNTFLADKLKEHLDKTNDLVKKLEEKSNIQAAAKINSHLKYLLLAHMQVNQTSTTTTSTISTATTTPNIIVTASTTVNTSTTHIDDDEDEDEKENKWKDNKFNWGKLQKEIRSQLASSTVWETNLQNQISTSTVQDAFKARAASGLKNAAENKLTEANKYFENKKDKLSAENKLIVQTKLNEANAVKTEADQKLTDGKYVEAFVLYNKSMRLAQDAKSLIEYAKKKHKKDEGNNTTSTKKYFEEDDEDENSTSTMRISDDENDDKKGEDKKDNKPEKSERKNYERNRD